MTQTDNEGGANVSGGVNVNNGDFVGRDNITINIYLMGDTPHLSRTWMAGLSPKVIQEYLDSLANVHRFVSWRMIYTAREVDSERVYIPQGLTRLQESFGAEAGSNPLAHTATGHDALETLLRDRFVVVLGQPGSGKTQLLRHLTLRLAQDSISRLREGREIGFIPIYISLAEFDNPTRQMPLWAITQLILNAIRKQSHTLGVHWEALMEDGRLVFLFDALDEVQSRELQKQLIEGMRDFAAGLGTRCPIVLTSREATYGDGLPILGHPFKVYRLNLLKSLDVNHAIPRWWAALSGLDVRNQSLIERESQPLSQEIASRPYLRDTLRNPLLLWLTVRSFLSEQRIPSLGKRFESYVDDTIDLKRDVHGRKEAAWSDPREAKRYLQTIAWAMQEDPSIFTVSQVVHILETRCQTNASTARFFIQQMVERAGLLRKQGCIGADRNDDNSIVSFAPHQTFFDFFVGRHLAQQWQQDQYQTRQFLQAKTDNITLHKSIFFCLGLLYEDESERNGVLDFVTEETNRLPEWGVRCIHEGLELTGAELPAKTLNRIYRSLSSKARFLFSPNRAHLVLIQLRYRTGEARREWLREQFDAINALAALQIPGSGMDILIAMFRVAVGREYTYLTNDLRDPLVALGPQCLWPQIQEVLTDGEEWIRTAAAGVVSSWQQPEALEPLMWMLDHTEFAEWAIQGIAQLGTEESESLFNELLDDPQHDRFALGKGILLLRQDVVDRAITALRAKELNGGEQRRLIETVLEMPLTQATKKIAEILPLLDDESERWQLFKVSREQQLPALRVLVSLLHHSDIQVLEPVYDVVRAVSLAGDFDPKIQDTQYLLEQLLVYARGEDFSLPELAAKQLKNTTISQEACQALYRQLMDPATRDDTIRILREAPPLPYPCRQKILEELRKEMDRGQYRKDYMLSLLARLGGQDNKDVENSILQLVTSTEEHLYRRRELIMELVRLQSRNAYPYIIDLFLNDEEYEWEGLAALAVLAPKLSPSQRTAASNLVKPRLQSSSLPEKWRAAYTLGQLRDISNFQDILGALHAGDSRIQLTAVGLSLGNLEDHGLLAEHLENEFNKRDGLICSAVLYAWGSCGKPDATNPLAHALILPENFLLSADKTDYFDDLIWACSDLRAIAAFNLSYLVAGLCTEKKGSQADLTNTWAKVVDKFEGSHAFVRSGYASMLEEAIRTQNAARTLYESSLRLKGKQLQDVLGLVGAYEWSQVLVQMATVGAMDSQPVWESISKLFSPLGKNDVTDGQAILSSAIKWSPPVEPFHYFLGYREHKDGVVEDYSTHFFRQVARDWSDWVKWKENYLSLPR